MEMLTELICGPKKARKLWFIRRTCGRKLFAEWPFYTPLFHADVISVARRSLSLRMCSGGPFQAYPTKLVSTHQDVLNPAHELAAYRARAPCARASSTLEVHQRAAAIMLAARNTSRSARHSVLACSASQAARALPFTARPRSPSRDRRYGVARQAARAFTPS